MADVKKIATRESYGNAVIYKDRQGQLRQTSSELKFDKLPFELENGACGTEGMVLLSDYWLEHWLLLKTISILPIM